MDWHTIKKAAASFLVISILLNLNLEPKAFSSEQGASEFVTPCVWQHIQDYSEGLAVVQEEDFNGVKGKYGYMDRFGKLQIPLAWDVASNFRNGLAAVEKDGKWGYINQAGEIVIPLQFGSAHDFSEGIAAVDSVETNKSGYIDLSGNIVVPLEYDVADTFADGFGKVETFGKSGAPDSYAEFDKNGVMNPDWSIIGEFSEGLAWASGNGGRGYIDKAGKLIFNVAQGWGCPFHNGRAHIIDDGGNKDYYIDKEGEIVIAPQYYRCGEFNEGYAVVQKGIYYADNDELIIDIDGNILGKFEDGVAYNPDKKMIWLYDYSQSKVYTYTYNGDIANLKGMGFDFGKSGKSLKNAIVASKQTENGFCYGVLDANFNIIIPFEYQDIQVLSDEYIRVSKKERQWGLIDYHNNLIVDYGNLYINPPHEGRFVTYESGAGFGIMRFENDGELYTKPAQSTIGTAYATDININSGPEKAYVVDQSTYVSIETLRKYGVAVSRTKDGNNINLTRQASKNPVDADNAFTMKDSYRVYPSDYKVSVLKDIVDSRLIEEDLVVNVDSLKALGTIHNEDGIINIDIDRPYMPGEGITWEWRTDLFDVNYVCYGEGSYALVLYGGGIILNADGTILYQNNNATSCVYYNGIWKVRLNWSEEYVYVNSKGEVVEAPSEFNIPSPTPTPAAKTEYPVPFYKYEDYWDGSLYGRKRPVPISTGKYVDEKDNVVLENPNWTWTAPFQNGTALVNVDGSMNPVGELGGGKWGLIDTSGNYIVQPVWDDADRIYDGNIIVRSNGKYGLVNGMGVQLVPFEYDRMYIKTNDSVISVELNGKCGLINAENEVLLPCIFDIIEKDREHYYSVTFTDQYVGYRKGIIQLIDTPVLKGSVYVNDAKVDFPVPPMIINNRTMIPVRAVFEKMGYTVDWDDEKQTVLIDGKDTQIRVSQDQNGFIKNDSYIYCDMPSINYQDRIYLPLRALTEAIGCNVNYDDASGNVMIAY